MKGRVAGSRDRGLERRLSRPEHQETPPAPSRKRGRPPGSKNKPKTNLPLPASPVEGEIQRSGSFRIGREWPHRPSREEIDEWLELVEKRDRAIRVAEICQRKLSPGSKSYWMVIQEFRYV